MSATATMNGKPQRKQLSDQLDRLDGIVDLLAEGLPGAVADACRDGARLAVKDAVLEILSNPELRAMLTLNRPDPAWETHTLRPEPTPAPMEPKPSLWSRLKAGVAAVRESLAGATAKTKKAVATRYAAKDAVVAVSKATGEALPLQRVGLIAAGVGLVVGVACLVVPQTVAAAVGAIGATTAVGVQAGFWLKNAARRLGLVS